MPRRPHLYDEAYIRDVPSPYSPSQVRQYLRRISWPFATPVPLTIGDNDDAPVDFPTDVENLAQLMFLHCTTFAAENTDLQ